MSSLGIDLEEPVRSPNMPPECLLHSTCNWLLDFAVVLRAGTGHPNLRHPGFAKYFYIELLIDMTDHFVRQLETYSLLECSQ